MTEKPAWMCLETNCKNPHGVDGPGKHRCPRCKERKRARSKRYRMQIKLAKKPCKICGAPVAGWSKTQLCGRCYEKSRRHSHPPREHNPLAEPLGFAISDPGMWGRLGDD